MTSGDIAQANGGRTAKIRDAADHDDEFERREGITHDDRIRRRDRIGGQRHTIRGLARLPHFG